MNKIFHDISLAAGGSHYPTINPDLQQRFGELVIEQVLATIQHRISAAQTPIESTVLAELREDLLANFELEWMDPNWDAAAELQRICDEFEIGGKSQ